jgi:HD-GYP domain-containing protein (c-di-GMP phosphodiesterase class II)
MVKPCHEVFGGSFMSMPELRLQILDDGLKVLKRPVEKQNTDYTPIPLTVLMPGERVTFDLYLKVTAGEDHTVKFTPYLAEGETLEPRWLEKLEKLGIDKLYFRKEDLDRAIAYLNNHLLVASSAQGKSSKEFTILREHLSFNLRAAFDAPHLGPHVDLAKKSLTNLFKFMQNSQLSQKYLLEIIYRDYTLYNHSVNVAVLGMAMGAFLKRGTKECLALGLAGLFHDLGLIKISEEITSKKDPLTPEEWELLKKHPCFGYRLLKGNTEIPLTSLRLVLEHHENADGSGYSQGLELSRQHPLTRIMALLEAYDGLTMYRPYRPRHTPFAALKILQEERGSHGGAAFEPETLKRFIKFLALT